MSYYAEKLSGNRLRECYEIAPPRVKRYLEAEIQYLISLLNSTDKVLELGCGYGRVVLEISKFVREIVGIDTARESITLAMALKEDDLKCTFYEMNAINLKFNSEFFDKVYCIQNGISAFGVNKKSLLKEALRVTKSGGKVIFSSYTKEFWPHRLEWFSLQAKNGLIGEIDFNKTGNGYIVCKDGFRAGYMREKGFEEICKYFGFKPHITKIDNSSLFCEIEKS